MHEGTFEETIYRWDYKLSVSLLALYTQSIETVVIGFMGAFI